MKFLKTFLFTISLTFLYFGVYTLKGFCASVALDGASSAVHGVVSSGVNSMGSFGFDPVSMSIIATEAYDELDSYLYVNTGYDVEDYYNRGVEQQQKFTASIDNTPLIADAIANKMTNNLYNAAALSTLGYQIISKNVQQFGSDAKAWFFGKVDSVTNTVNEAVGNMVTKVTAQGMTNYRNALMSLISNGVLSNISDNHAVYSNTFRSNGVRSSNLGQSSCLKSEFKCSFPFYVYSDSTMNYSIYRNYVVVPVSAISHQNEYSYYFSCNGFFVDGNGNQYNLSEFRLASNASRFTINGVDYLYGPLSFLESSYGYFDYVGSLYPFGSLSEVQTMIGNNVSAASGLAYDYSASTLSSIQSLLNQLVGKYVDTDTMDKISTIIREIPVQGVIEGDVTVPEAVVTPEQVQALQDAIDEAIALSESYAAILDSDTPVPDPDPESSPNNQGTEVPEDFPATILSPINDTVGGVFDFVSIFEPLFYIFSFSTGLLGLWLVIPFVILFMFLFKLLK